MSQTLLLAIGQPFYRHPAALARLAQCVEELILVPQDLDVELFCQSLRVAGRIPRGVALSADEPYPELLLSARQLGQRLALPVLVVHEQPQAALHLDATIGSLALRCSPEEARSALTELLQLPGSPRAFLASQTVASLASEGPGEEASNGAQSTPASAARIYTIDQLARLCDLPITALREHLASGRLSAKPNPLGGTWTIGEDELRRFLLENGLDTRGSEKPLRILIADDEDSVVSLIGSAIQFAGYNVQLDSADNGYDAMLKIGSTRPDLVILDVQMPGADGKMVLQAIRSNAHTSGTRILVVSGNPDAVTDMRQRGADDSLVKPFDLQSLLGKLEALLPSLKKRRTP